MAVKSAQYLANATANTFRGPSASIWGAPGTPNAWVEDFLQDPSLGMHFFDDFLVAPNFSATSGAAVVGSFGLWSIYAGKTGALTDAGIVGGGITLTPGTSTTGEPMTLCSSAGAFQITSASAASGLQGRLAFEARVMLQSVVASKRDAFVGLCDQGAPASNVPIGIGTGTNQLATSQNLIGFYNAYSGGGQDWGFVFQLASTAPVFCTGLQSLISSVTGSAIAANTWYKLGFIYNPNAPVGLIGTASNGQTVGQQARQMIQVFVNGLPAAAFLTSGANILTASFPTGVMGPVVSIMNDVSSVGASTNAGALSIDWLRVAQTALT